MRYFKLNRPYPILFNSSNFFLNSKGLYQSSGKEKESCCLILCSRPRRNVKISIDVVVVKRQQRNVQKSVIHVKGDKFCYPCLHSDACAVPYLKLQPSQFSVLCNWVTWNNRENVLKMRRVTGIAVVGS